MIDGYSGCESCPLKACPPVLGWGPADGLMVIGEAPGVTEVVKGRPFVGDSGKLFDTTIEALGVHRDDVYVTNACLCRPPGNATPDKKAVQACYPRLLQEIDNINPTKILTLGATALSSIENGGVKPVPITKNRGLGRVINGRYTVATYHPSAVLRDPDLFRDLVFDITKFLLHDAPIPEFPIETIIPITPADAIGALTPFWDASILGCDLETTGFDFRVDRILSIGFGALTSEKESGYAVIISFEIADDPDVKQCILQLLANFTGKMTFHNGKFDMQFLMWWDQDVDLWPKDFVDTMLMQCALDERGATEQSGSTRGYRTLGLKEQARLRYDIPDYYFDFKKFFKLPEDERDYQSLYVYQGVDCVTTVRLQYDLFDELIEESPKLWEFLCQKIFFPGARALARVEWNGFPIDLEYLEGLKIQLQAELLILSGYLQSIAAHPYGFENLNCGSPIVVRKVWKAMKFEPPTGVQREEIMLMLKQGEYPDDVRDFVNGILEYRQKSKLLSTYVLGPLERVGTDGRVRSDFLQTGADTGRLASRDPNLQNIPTLVGPIIRKAFISPPGWTLAEIDYSQLELRVIAWQSRDADMIEAFVDGRDIHRIVASNMFKKPEAEITHLERYMAKYVDFGIIYGRGAPSLASGWEMEYVVEQGGKPWTVPEAEEFLAEFLDGFPGLKKYIAEQHKAVVQNHYVETPTGRRRRFNLINRRNVGQIQRQAVNTPTQGYASEICLYNLVALDDTLPRDEAQVVSIVHDAIYVLIRNDKLEKWLPYCMNTMRTNTPVPFDVPLDVEAKIGTRWGELKVVHM